MSLVLVFLLSSGPTLGAPAADDRVRGPHVCVAQWVRPIPTCQWDDPVVVKASGRSRASAERGAVSRLRAVLSRLSQAAELDAAATSFPGLQRDFTGCPGVDPEAVMVQCLSKPALVAISLCVAELPADPCWSPTTLPFEGVGWRAAEQARTDTCTEIDQQIDAGPLSQADRLRCQARCLSSVLVRCREQ
ncbi:MAG: hypothetical protein GXP62_11655 [Oligoflexia bacterium]|nr:hypothetical protein [Oligoflexia bacterium]